MAVVLPAPSGPSRPNISPLSTVKLIPLTACSPSKSFRRSIMSITRELSIPVSLPGNLVYPDPGIRRHPRLQLTRFIVHIYPNRIYQLDPFLFSLYLLGGKLRHI